MVDGRSSIIDGRSSSICGRSSDRGVKEYNVAVKSWINVAGTSHVSFINKNGGDCRADECHVGAYTWILGCENVWGRRRVNARTWGCVTWGCANVGA
jgi:hypothetical protein